jgi:hypothetical protein
MQQLNTNVSALAIAAEWMPNAPLGAGAGARCLPSGDVRSCGALPNRTGSRHR